MEKFEDENYESVTKLLLSCRFQPQMQGFDYIRSAVLYYLKNGKKKGGVTTELYPMLARIYNTKQASIERDIRNSIDIAYKNNGLLSLNDYFDAVVYTNKYKFSNNELISILVEVIKLDKLRRGFLDKLKAE